MRDSGIKIVESTAFERHFLSTHGRESLSVGGADWWYLRNIAAVSLGRWEYILLDQQRPRPRSSRPTYSGRLRVGDYSMSGDRAISHK